MIAFVHIDGEGEYSRWGDCLARLMVRSVRKHMPDATITHFMDQRSYPIEIVDRALMVQAENEYLMPFRLKCFSEVQGEAIFLDTDILITGPLDDVFDDDFDVAMVRRDGVRAMLEGRLVPDMPYNTGFIASRNPEFFREAYAICMGYPRQYKQWFGDQLAIAQLATSGKYRIKDLGREWNHPVQAPDDYGARVLHYKGPRRKSWMPVAAEVLLSA